MSTPPTDKPEEKKSDAGSLQQEIDDLIAGKTHPEPTNMREFVEQKMAELRRQRELEKESGESPAKSDA